MSEENMRQEFILKKVDETRNYLTEETNQNELMSKKHENVYRVCIILSTCLFQFQQLVDPFPFLLLLL